MSFVILHPLQQFITGSLVFTHPHTLTRLRHITVSHLHKCMPNMFSMPVSVNYMVEIENNICLCHINF